jgi:hypothetical protein
MGESSFRGVLTKRGPEMVIEAFFIVFAVMVALAVDEWRQSQELRAQAEQAKAAVLSELEANQSELRIGGPSMAAMLERVSETVQRLRRGEVITALALSGELPDFSDAAWETARVTGAVARMDYEWVLQTARVYQVQALTLDLQRDVLTTIGSLAVRPLELERATDLQGQLMILTEVHNQLGERYEDLEIPLGQTEGLESDPTI